MKTAGLIYMFMSVVAVNVCLEICREVHALIERSDLVCISVEQARFDVLPAKQSLR